MGSDGPVIVAIDDYKDNLIAVKAFVTDAFPGARVFTADNGSDGIDLAREKNPDVILLDIVMPGMDGFQVCRLLKEDPTLRFIPVIFLTAIRDDKGSRIRALEVGGEAFLSKPFEEAEFIAQIRAMVKIKAANDREMQEKASLAALVAERTGQLEKELLERRKAEQELKQANQVLTQSRAAMLNLLADLKEEVEARKKGEELLQTAMTNLQGVVFSLDKDGIFLLSEGKSLSSLGLQPGQVVGKSVFDVYRDVPDVITGMKTALAGSPWSGLVSVQDHSFDAIVSPVFDDMQKVNGLVGVATDVTGRKLAESALYEAIQKLRLLTGLTRHDIFNQVSAVEILLDMIVHTGDLTKIEGYVSRAQQACVHMNATIGFTREYENFGTVSSGWQQVHTLIELALKEFSPGLFTIENRVPEDLEIYADPIIRKVFTTLIENSFRHGGQVSRICFSGEQADGSYRIIVQDDGSGIPEEEKGRIFDHGFGKNTGIGLFLAREILSITGLSIRETGDPGNGARFEILVPEGKFRTEPGDGE